MLMCGIPRVTLLGARDDWVNLRARVDKFDQFGDGMGEALATRL